MPNWVTDNASISPDVPSGSQMTHAVPQMKPLANQPTASADENGAGPSYTQGFSSAAQPGWTGGATATTPIILSPDPDTPPVQPAFQAQNSHPPPTHPYAEEPRSSHQSNHQKHRTHSSIASGFVAPNSVEITHAAPVPPARPRSTPPIPNCINGISQRVGARPAGPSQPVDPRRQLSAGSNLGLGMSGHVNSNSGFAAHANQTRLSATNHNANSSNTEPIVESIVTVKDGQTFSLRITALLANKVFRFIKPNGVVEYMGAMDVFKRIAPHMNKAEIEYYLRQPDQLQKCASIVYGNTASGQQSAHSIMQAMPHPHPNPQQRPLAQPSSSPRTIAPIVQNGLPSQISMPLSLASPQIQVPQSTLHNQGAQSHTTSASSAGLVNKPADSLLDQPKLVEIQAQVAKETKEVENLIGQGWERMKNITSAAIENIAAACAAAAVPPHSDDGADHVRKLLADEQKKSARINDTIVRLTRNESDARGDLEEANRRVQTERDLREKLQVEVAALTASIAAKNNGLASSQAKTTQLELQLKAQIEKHTQELNNLRSSLAKTIADQQTNHQTTIQSLKSDFAGKSSPVFGGQSQAQASAHARLVSNPDAEVQKLRDLLRQKTLKMAELDEENKKKLNETVMEFDALKAKNHAEMEKAVKAQVAAAFKYSKVREEKLEAEKLKLEGEIEVYKTKLASIAEPAPTPDPSVSPTNETATEVNALREVLEKLLSHVEELQQTLGMSALGSTGTSPDLVGRAESFLGSNVVSVVKDLQSNAMRNQDNAASSSKLALKGILAWGVNIQRIMGKTFDDLPSEATDNEKAGAFIKNIHAAFEEMKEKHQHDNQALRERVAALEQDVKAKEASIEAKNAQFDQQEQELADSQGQYEAKLEELQQASAELDELRADREMDDNQLEGRLDFVNGDADTISRLNNEVVQLHETVHKKDQELKSRNDEVQGLKEEVDILKEKIKELHGNVQSLNKLVEESQAKVDDCQTTIKELELDLSNGMDTQFRQREEADKLEKEHGDLKAETNKWKEATKKLENELKGLKNNKARSASRSIEEDQHDFQVLPGPSNAKTLSRNDTSKTATPAPQIKNTPARSSLSNSSAPLKRRIEQSPLFLPGDEEDDHHSTPASSQAKAPVIQISKESQAQTLPRAIKRRRILSEEGSPVVDRQRSVVDLSRDPPSLAGSPAAKANGLPPDFKPVTRGWISRNVDLCIERRGGKLRCKLCLLKLRKTAPGTITIIDVEPLETRNESEVVDHLETHPEVLRRLRDKRVKEGKDKPSPSPEPCG